jgi:hypothetical protein
MKKPPKSSRTPPTFQQSDFAGMGEARQQELVTSLNRLSSKVSAAINALRPGESKEIATPAQPEDPANPATEAPPPVPGEPADPKDSSKPR